MQLNRQLEERMVRLFRQNKIVGGVYSSLGQEAVSVGTAYALEPRDWLAPMIRNIGALLVKGFKPRDIFTQHMAKYTSPTQGKDGTSHFGDLKDRHVVSPISMLGDLIPVMTGVAMAGRYLGQKIVAMTWIGDGGSSTGAFHEGLNLAAAQRAPARPDRSKTISGPIRRPSRGRCRSRDLADRAAAYGIASKIVDGNDVVAVYHAAKSCGRPMPRRPRPRAARSENHAHERPRAARPRRIRPQGNVRILEGAGPHRALRKISHRTQALGAAKKSEIDARIERELDADQKFAEESPAAAAGTRRAGRLLRRLPHDRSGMAARHRRK